MPQQLTWPQAVARNSPLQLTVLPRVPTLWGSVSVTTSHTRDALKSNTQLGKLSLLGTNHRTRNKLASTSSVLQTTKGSSPIGSASTQTRRRVLVPVVAGKDPSQSLKPALFQKCAIFPQLSFDIQTHLPMLSSNMLLFTSHSLFREKLDMLSKIFQL